MLSERAVFPQVNAGLLPTEHFPFYVHTHIKKASCPRIEKLQQHPSHTPLAALRGEKDYHYISPPRTIRMCVREKQST